MAHSGILFDKKKNASFGRLHVGYRASHWTKVWYQPAPEAEVDDDGTVEIGLFKLSTGGATRREPMMGEVVWLPHFELKVFKSTKNAEKERLQMQYLYDAWRYLNEPDPHQVLQLEQELDDPFNRQWQSWFEDAKKWKSSKLRRRSKRRTARTVAVRSAGIDLDNVEVNSDTSEDSAYESEEDLFVRDKEPIGPPGSTGKRKAGGNGGGPPNKKSPNKSKSSPGDKAKPRGRASDQDVPISGGLGDMRDRGGLGGEKHLGGSLFGRLSFGSRTNLPGLDNDEDNDNASRGSRGSLTYDNRSPEPLPARRNGSASNTSTVGQREAGQAVLRDRFKHPAAAEAARARLHNGDLGESEAFNWAIRESSQLPENGSNGSQSNGQNGANGTGEHEG